MWKPSINNANLPEWWVGVWGSSINHVMNEKDEFFTSKNYVNKCELTENDPNCKYLMMLFHMWYCSSENRTQNIHAKKAQKQSQESRPLRLCFRTVCAPHSVKFIIFAQHRSMTKWSRRPTVVSSSTSFFSLCHKRSRPVEPVGRCGVWSVFFLGKVRKWENSWRWTFIITKWKGTPNVRIKVIIDPRIMCEIGLSVGFITFFSLSSAWTLFALSFLIIFLGRGGDKLSKRGKKSKRVEYISQTTKWGRIDKSWLRQRRRFAQDVSIIEKPGFDLLIKRTFLLQ